MTAATIVLLVLGAAIVVASFFIPDKEDREDKQDIAKKQEQIRRLMEAELDNMKLRVNEATNETVEVGMEKGERALEKITNDKIMAVNEYATTVIEEIDRNHKEVMFLYDMLNDKQTDVKNTVRHAEAAVKEANDAAKTASDTAQYAVNVANAAGEAVGVLDAATHQADQQILAAQLGAALFEKAVVSGGIPEPDPSEKPGIDMSKLAPSESVFGMAASMEGFDSFSMSESEPIEPVLKKEEPVQPVVQENEKELTDFEILERDTSFKNVSNNNQMILKMNAQGMSAVDIARQLSLGVGEVQLVIDLFK